MAKYNINNNMFHQTNNPLKNQFSQKFINIILEIIDNINIDTEPENIIQLGNILTNKLTTIKQEVKELTNQLNEIKNTINN